jgi:hypothetical protein
VGESIFPKNRIALSMRNAKIAKGTIILTSFLGLVVLDSVRTKKIGRI